MISPKFASLLHAVVHVLSLLIITRLVATSYGLEVLGLWSLLTGTVGFLRVMDLGGANTLARQLALNSNDVVRQSQLLDTLSVFCVVIYSIAAFALLPFLEAILPTSAEYPVIGADVKQLLAYLVLLVPLQVLLQLQFGALDGVNKVGYRSSIGISCGIVNVLVVVSLLPTVGFISLIFGQFAQVLVGNLLCRSVLYGSISPLQALPSYFSKDALSEVVSFGGRLQVGALPYAIMDPLLRTYIGSAFGLSQVAIFELAMKMAVQLRAMIQAYLNPLVPQFTTMITEGSTEIQASLNFWNLRASMFVIILFGLLALCSDYVSLAFLGDINSQFQLLLYLSSAAWGLASLGVVVQLYARANNLLSWSIRGQWLMLLMVCAIITTNTLVSTFDFSSFCGLIFVSIAIGHISSFIGETKSLSIRISLIPFRG